MPGSIAHAIAQAARPLRRAPRPPLRRAAATPALAAPALKVVSYHGYRVRVPASWPVYDLAQDPAVCVRFDRHAVYLGTPSAAQRCPAHAAGRTEAILLQPTSPAPPRPTRARRRLRRGGPHGRARRRRRIAA